MYTSDNSGRAEYLSSAADVRTAFIYLIISILLALAGAVYEHFSFGVYSYFMIYAFMITLAGGALPYLIRYIRGLRGGFVSRRENPIHRVISDWMWHLGIATLTAGSIVHGILAICGRPNSLTIVYLLTGAALLVASFITKVIGRANKASGMEYEPMDN